MQPGVMIAASVLATLLDTNVIDTKRIAREAPKDC